MLQLKGSFGCLLEGKVTDWPSIWVTKTEQQKNIGRPRTNAGNRNKQRPGVLRRHAGKLVERQRAEDHGLGCGAQRPHFCPRKTARLKNLIRRSDKLRRIEWLNGASEALINRLGARGRELLGDDDRGEACKFGLPSP